MPAEMVISALAQEAVNQVLSRIKEGHAEKSDAKDHIERMEMAHIKLEAALETSKKWNVTSMPLLRWRSKLKRASQECNNTLRRCRQRLQEEEEVQHAVRRSSFPKRIAHTGMSFVSSIFSHNNDDELNGSTVTRRFERFAEGACEFLRYVELGGTPCTYMFSDPLIRHLITGKGTKYCFVNNGQHLSFLLQPSSPLQEHGIEVGLVFLLEDSNTLENSFALFLNLRLSESTDIIRIAVGCVDLFIPYLGSTIETVKTKLTQVPTQELCWVSDAYPVFSHCVEQQNNLHTIWSKWFRPNPLCCHQQENHSCESYNSKSSSSRSLTCDINLEPVIQMYFLGHVAQCVGNNRQRAVADRESKTSPLSEFPYLKLGMHFYPHAPYVDLPPGVEGSATEMINGAAVKHGLYAKICFGQLGDFMIRKAVDCFRGSEASTSYQMLWKSKHGGAHLQAEKISWVASSRSSMGGKRPKQQQGKKVLGWRSGKNEDFLSSWVAHAPANLQSSVMDLVQKQKRLPLPLLYKSNPCIDDCPIILNASQYNRSLARKIKSCSMFRA